MRVTVKVAQSALQVSLAPWERAGVMQTVMAAATYIVWGGAGAMAVSGYCARGAVAQAAPQVSQTNVTDRLGPTPIYNAGRLGVS
jgi:hypothetical protein